jgi:broad specificity phosphatase PhoE
MTKSILIAIFLFGLQNVAQAQNEGEIFTVYLARHAEQESEYKDPSNPPLSPCGELRAQSLANMLSDVSLEKIYSTPYERTLGSARPSAESRQLEIEIYDPRKLEEFARLLLDRQQDVLVLGHSNTTAVLAGLLAGEVGEAFDHDIFDRLYQVVISAELRSINLLHQAFHCDL